MTDHNHANHATPKETGTETEPPERTADPRQSPLLAGATGGIVGTVAMTVLRAPTARSLPPTAEFLSRWLGGAPEDYPLSSLALHLAYGAGAGAAFGLGARRSRSRVEEPEAAGLLAGVVYAALLSVFGERVVVRHLVGLDLDTDESAVFHAGHLVYGLTLGTWVGSRIPHVGSDDPDRE